MNPDRDMTHLFDRVASGEDSAAIRSDLRRVSRVRGDRNVVQVGDHNIALHDAHDIHIDNRTYHGAEAEAIRRALQDVVVTQGPEQLRGVGGVVTTIGMVVALAGMAMFFYGLISTMGGGFSDGPPPVLMTGFAVAAVGVGIGVLGGLISAWQRPRR